MYIIAIILNCLNFFAVIAMFGGAYVMKHYPSQVAKFAADNGIEELNTIRKVLDMVNPVIIAAVVSLVAGIVILVFGIRALKRLEKNELNATPHIVVLVLGAVFGELFYLLAGIFGTVNASQAKNRPTAPTPEVPTEQPKE